MNGTRPLTIKHHSLTGRITDKLMSLAFRAVRKNRGAAGVDRVSLKMFEDNPRLLWNVTRLLAQRIRVTDEALADSVFLDVTGRTAKRLLELADGSDEFTLPVTQEELVRALARVAGVEPLLTFVPRETLIARGGGIFEPPYYFGQYFDMPAIVQKTERARDELGFEARDFEEGLAGSFAWYQRQGVRKKPDVSWEDELPASLEVT